MTFPARIDPDAPLPDEIKLYIAQQGPQMLRALVNELGTKNEKIRQLEQRIAVLTRRVGDSRGVADA